MGVGAVGGVVEVVDLAEVEAEGFEEAGKRGEDVGFEGHGEL